MATGLDAGPHQLTLTDANGCAQQASISVAEYPAIELTDTAVTSASGQGQSDGAISIGGVPALYLVVVQRGEHPLSQRPARP